jgi:hypothetical protein
MSRKGLLLVFLGLIALMPALPLKAAPLEVRVLLVGVGHFATGSEGLDPLEGPANDIAAMQSSLQARLATLHPQFKVLQDGAATHDAILQEIHDFLGPLKSGSTAIFYFSGHGSRVYGVDPHKPDRYDSTLIPYDARLSGHATRDIRDVELGAKLGELDVRGVHVIAILDSCFSGGATRGRGKVRFAPATGKLPPPSVVTDVSAPPAAPIGQWVSLRTRRANQVVFSASEGDSKAYESVYAGTAMGEFTRAMVDSLRIAPPTMTYRELAFNIRSRFQHWRVEQSPHVEGDLDQLAFEPGSGRGRAVIEAQALDSGHYQMGAGSLVGITQGSEYGLYATASQASFAAPSAALGVAAVQTVTLKTATLEVSEPHLPKTVFLSERTHKFLGEPVRVWLDDSVDARVQQAIRQNPGAITGVVLAPEESAEISIALKSGQLVGQPATGRPIPIPESTGVTPEESILAFFRSAARAKALLDLRQNDSTIEAHMRVLIVDSASHGLLAPEQHDGAFIVRAGDVIRVCLENGASTAGNLHFYLFGISDQFDIDALFPPLTQGSDVPLRKNVSIPTDTMDVLEAGVDTLKLIVTSTEIPAYVVSQVSNDGQGRGVPPSSFSPLDQYLSDAAKGLRIGPRSVGTIAATREALVEIQTAQGPRHLAATTCQ